MKIAILGGGITGLTAAYYLAKKNHSVTILEKKDTLGGMASGFKKEGWDWYLDKTYRHLFANDDDFLDFAREIKFNKIFFQEPETASLYLEVKTGPVTRQPQNEKNILGFPGSRHPLCQNNYLTIPVDTPQDFLKFPLLTLSEKIRAGIVVAFLKLSPFLKLYERQTAEGFLQKTMGDQVWDILWQELFRKKFGKYAGNILASFIWARIKKRTKSLGYVKGGFQEFVNYLEKVNQDQGAIIKKKTEIKNINKSRGEFIVNGEKFNAVISTLPTPILINVSQDLFQDNYLNRLKKIKYLHAINLILETDRPLLKKTYWLNICDKNIPIMGLVQHTNFINKKYFNNKHILYVANYIDDEDRLLKMTDREVLNYFLPYLKKINKMFYASPAEVLTKVGYTLHVFRYAQPIFTKEFIQSKPDFTTPVKNFFIANLDMTYPYDRGTNYAVKLGKKVADFL